MRDAMFAMSREMMRLERTRTRGEGRVSGTDGMCAGARVTMRASRRIANRESFGERPVARPPRARSRRDSDATKRHLAVRKTLVFLSRRNARPVPAVDARVDLARTFVGGFVSVPASAGAFPGSVSEGDISGAFLRRNGPRGFAQALFATSVR